MPHHSANPLGELSRLIQSPFARLRTALDGIEPGLPPVDMTIGEPRHAMPGFLAEALQAGFAGYAKYPPIQGTPELVGAIGAWLQRRYPALQGAIDPARHILPLSGSREGLFTAIFPAIARRASVARPAVLMPNPFYQAYLAAAVAAGAEPVFLAAEQSTGFLPDLDAIPADTLARTVAFYLASPANPQGSVASPAYLAKAIGLAREYDFLLFLDECYSEVYTALPPTGGLETAHRLGAGDFANVLTFNSLSKRSNVPGLRSGFIAGDENFLAAFAKFRNVAAPQLALPVQHASAVLWGEESHVEASRAIYVEKFALARAMLGGALDFADPAGSFFLWPKMDHFGGGEAAAKTFWKECGVKLLPGAYLAQTDSAGHNPGADYVRIALVDDLALTREAFARLTRYLS
ncbi:MULTISPECIES: aminotransferase class I/II-fold pyridoxal phosphate-dependent enzyme [Rhodomicrobium]|uniref:aminotransferase class I/II-fold pyridoxal phosphate-dependent enzyme n=1 Tax=Rhodomicrobium TaxID=1068 RepID=UPI000B4BF9EB|nr:MULTISPECIES: aminotransferase class I/II-fold pyridoxal phosphate-dependent enzyme [Rhodomicrobium]